MDKLSDTAADLMNRVGRGAMHFSDAQQICSNVVKDYGAQGDMTEGLYSMGKNGQLANNISRETLSWSRSTCPQFPIGNIKVTAQDPQSHKRIEVNHSVCWPHETFGATYRLLPEKDFMEIWFGSNDTAEAKTFWNRQCDQEWVKEHPGLQGVDSVDYGNFSPVYVHADEGRHIKGEKILCVSLGACLTKLSTLVGHFLYSMFPVTMMVKGVTEEQLYAGLVWSFGNMMAGTYPWAEFGGAEFKKGSWQWLMRGKALAGPGVN
jgi:hypothetical protein